jgi:hypothetical protein
MKTVVVFIGPAGAGKSTASQVLINNYGFKRESFADPLKRIALEFGFDHKELYGTQTEKSALNKFWGVSGREFMQKFGTDLCRDVLPTVIPKMDVGSSIWIKLMERKIQQSDRIVIDDCRFQNEADFIRSINANVYFIRIDRETQTMTHVSELEQKNIEVDYHVYNNYTKNQLEKNIHFIIRQLPIDPIKKSKSVITDITISVSVVFVCLIMLFFK